MSKVKWLDEECNVCGSRLNSWDAKISKALMYQNKVCEKCIANEYDMDVDSLRSYFEEVFDMRPCAGI